LNFGTLSKITHWNCCRNAKHIINPTLLDQTTTIGDSAPQRYLHDPIRIAMRDEMLWRQEKAIYAEHRMKHMVCLGKLCKGNMKQMAMDTIGKHLMENGRCHSCQRWRGPGVEG
jgi:hypothetical protein